MSDPELEAARRIVSGEIACSTLEEHLARALIAAAQEGDRMREALRELADAAEKDLRANQDDDEEHVGGGWWSIRTEDAIREARAALAKVTP